MPFQKTVRRTITSGVLGDISFDIPSTAESKILKSTLGGSLLNFFGRAYQQVQSQEPQTTGNDFVTLNPSGATSFAGILVNPKEHVLTGNDSTTTVVDQKDVGGLPQLGALGEQAYLPNGTVASFLRTGLFLGTVTTSVKIGYEVYYHVNDGRLAGFAAGHQADKKYIIDQSVATAAVSLILNPNYVSGLARLPGGEVRYADAITNSGTISYAWIYVNG